MKLRNDDRLEDYIDLLKGRDKRPLIIKRIVNNIILANG
jgi:hypothetical protein